MDVSGIFVSDLHLILMDIGLPLSTMVTWCQEIRKVSKVPIMFLSSRDQAMDIVMAHLNIGETTSSPSRLIKISSLLGQGLLRRSLAIWDRSNLLEHPRSHPQSQVHRLDVPRKKSLS